MLLTDARIVLAHESDFRIGPVSVRPSTREVERDGARQIIEPRVMQVLVALHRAAGAVVSKDDLILACWEGRVVGEDAINRVISRLRHLCSELGSDAFRIETVTRVGYRLIEEGASGASQAPLPREQAASLWSRRALVAAGGGAAIAGIGGVWVMRRDNDRLPDDVAELVQRGREAVLYGTLEQTASGISLLRQASAKAPESPEVWGALALAYGQQAQQSRESDYADLIQRARAAWERALALDPDNADAQVARALGWRAPGMPRENRDRACRAILTQFPDHAEANRALAFLLSQCGRLREALPYLEKAIAKEPYSPVDGYAIATTLWAVGRLDEADKAMERAYDLWPRHYGVWFSRYKHLLYSGRAAAAGAMLADIGQRPTGIPESNFRLCELEVRALATRDPAAIAEARKAHEQAARTGVGFAQNAMTFAAYLGDLDTAYAISDGLYFNRGFSLGDRRFTSEQGLFNPARRRPTYFLFAPPFRTFRADPRFGALTNGLGLEAYWRATGSVPDYRR